MEKITERFSIELAETGLVIQSREGTRVDSNPVSALMLLDIPKTRNLILGEWVARPRPHPCEFASNKGRWKQVI